MFLVTCSGNLLLLFLIGLNKKRHNTTNFLIDNLALVDLVMCIFCVPLMASYAYDKRGFISCPGGWTQTIPLVKKPNVEVRGWRGHTWSAVKIPPPILFSPCNTLLSHFHTAIWNDCERAVNQGSINPNPIVLSINIEVHYESCLSENRLKRIKGQCTEVTSREMLRSLSQAKQECWDRFLHDTQSSELFQEGELDQSALEHLKRWLVPEKVAISAEELEYLLLPSLSREHISTDQSQSGPEAATQNPEEDESHTPEK
ncbi:uncharacterized protein ACWYII_042206 [Salvelinus alpinus]